jgi:hypothetical protein
MPGKAHQASARLAQAAAAGPLSSPAAKIVFALTVGDVATVDVDWAGLAGMSFRVTDVRIVKVGAGGAGDTHQLRTLAGVAITDAMVTNVGDTVVVRAGSIDDAQHVIAAGGGLRVHVNDGGAGITSCIVYVEAELL